MAKKAYRQLGLKKFSGVSRNDLESLGTKLVETGRLSEEVVNSELDSIREVTGERAQFASETEKRLSMEQRDALLGLLKSRFETNQRLHQKIQWSDVEKALKANPDKLWSLQQMEATGGEPDIIGEEKGEFVFGDCSLESPSGRRNVVFDKEAQEYLKKHYPAEVCICNAADMAKEMGVDFMDEEQYRALQKICAIDKKNTWSWLKTPVNIRKSGDALYGRRYYGGEYVDQYNAHSRDDHGAWRAALRVPKA
jgi:hypothetical protein